MLTGLETLVQKTASPQRMARLQAVANHPSSNPFEAANARARMGEIRAGAPTSNPSAGQRPVPAQEPTAADRAPTNSGARVTGRTDPMMAEVEAMGQRSFNANPGMAGMGKLAPQDVPKPPPMRPGVGQRAAQGVMGARRAVGRYAIPGALAAGAGLLYAGSIGYDQDQTYKNLVSAPGMGGAY